MMWILQSYPTTVLNGRMTFFFGGGVKTWPVLFQRVKSPPTPAGSTYVRPCGILRWRLSSHSSSPDHTACMGSSPVGREAETSPPPSSPSPSRSRRQLLVPLCMLARPITRWHWCRSIHSRRTCQGSGHSQTLTSSSSSMKKNSPKLIRNLSSYRAHTRAHKPKQMKREPLWPLTLRQGNN